MVTVQRNYNPTTGDADESTAFRWSDENDLTIAVLEGIESGDFDVELWDTLATPATLKDEYEQKQAVAPAEWQQNVYTSLVWCVQHPVSPVKALEHKIELVQRIIAKHPALADEYKLRLALLQQEMPRVVEFECSL